MGMLKKGNVQLSGGRCPSPEALARHHGPTLNGTPELGRRQTKGPVARTAILALHLTSVQTTLNPHEFNTRVNRYGPGSGR